MVFRLDSLSGSRFLVDTRASVSVFPQASATPLDPAWNTCLLTAVGAPFPCFGACSIPLQFGSHRFSWSFQLAPVSVPILVSNFLLHHPLLVDIAQGRVLDSDSLDVLSTVSSSSSSDLFCAHLQTAPTLLCFIITNINCPFNVT